MNEYKNYRTCPCCGETFPLNRIYFKRLVTQGKEAFHGICKSCEDIARRNKEWKDGKLLCHCCGEYKDVEQYSTNGGANPIRNNRRSMCRECSTLRQKITNRSLPNDKKLDKCLRWRWLSARDRSRCHDLDFNLTVEYLKKLWIEQNGECSLSGIKMTYELQNGRTPTNVSIDKIDCTKGYVIGNVQLVCVACNQMKSDLSEDEMYLFCKKIVEKYESKNNKDSSQQTRRCAECEKVEARRWWDNRPDESTL